MDYVLAIRLYIRLTNVEYRIVKNFDGKKFGGLVTKICLAEKTFAE